MRFYIAARFDRLEEMNLYAQQLRNKGHQVECRWLQGLHQLHPGVSLLTPTGFETREDGITMLAQPFAQDDVEDLKNSDAIILFSEPPNSYAKRGGRHVEFGMAIALHLILIVIGQRENVFHCLPEVHRYSNWTEFYTQSEYI